MLIGPGASSKVRALRWHGAQRLRALENQIQPELQAWSDAWGLGPVVVGCEPATSLQTPGSTTWRALVAGDDGQTLAWLAGPADAKSLAAALFGDEPPPSGEPAAPTVAQAVANDAWQALRKAAAAGLRRHTVPAEQAVDIAELAARQASAWSGALRVTISLGGNAGGTWALHVDAELTDPDTRRPPVSRPPAGPLQSLPQALERHTVRVMARLADLSVALGDLLGVQMGDVLVVPHRLTDPLNVFTGRPAVQALCTARLVQREGHVCIALANAPATSSPTGSPLEGTRMNSPSSSRPSTADTAPAAQWVGLPDAVDPAPSAPTLNVATNPLLGVKATLQVCVGEAVLTVGELTQARVGQVIKLDREVDGLVDLMLDGQVVARGQLVAVDDCFGVRLTELPQPLPGSAA